MRIGFTSTRGFIMPAVHIATTAKVLTERSPATPVVGSVPSNTLPALLAHPSMKCCPARIALPQRDSRYTSSLPPGGAVLSLVMTWQSKPLRYGGVCDSCGGKIEVRATGWHNADLKKVRCATCGPPTENQAVSAMRPDPVGGSAALREGRSRHDHKWVKGAAGEYLMDQSL